MLMGEGSGAMGRAGEREGEIVGYHVGVKETRGEAKQGLSARNLRGVARRWMSCGGEGRGYAGQH